MAATYEARAFGVRSAMPAEKARRLCPGLVVVNADFDSYVTGEPPALSDLPRHGARRGGDVARGGLSRRPRARAHRGPARSRSRSRSGERVRDEIGLPLSVGIARTKGVAKMASKMSKPEGLLAVSQRGRAPVPPPHPGRAPVGRRRLDRGRSFMRQGSRRSAQVAAMTREELEIDPGPSGRAKPPRVRARARPAAGADRQRAALGRMRSGGLGCRGCATGISTRRSSRSSIA